MAEDVELLEYGFRAFDRPTLLHETLSASRCRTVLVSIVDVAAADFSLVELTQRDRVSTQIIQMMSKSDHRRNAGGSSRSSEGRRSTVFRSTPARMCFGQVLL